MSTKSGQLHSAIRVDLDALQFTLELGCEEFGKAIEIPFFPKVAGFRVIAAVYSQLELPENTSEAEAIEILKRFSGEEPFRTFIPVRDLKTTYVESDGSAARGG